MGHRQTVQTLIRCCRMRLLIREGLHCLLSEICIKIWIKTKNGTQQSLKQKWTYPIDKGRQVHLAQMG